MRAKRATMCPLLLVGFVLWAGVVVCDRDGPAEAITLDSLSVWQCDFQEDLCGLAPVGALEGAWQRVQTNQTTTTQDSWSVALAPGMSAGDRAGLMWPDLPPSASPRCLTFHYYLNGAQPGQLSVLLRGGGGGGGAAVWTRGWPEGPQWQAANIDLHLNVTVSVVFEGVKGSNLASVVGLDDIKLENGTCDAVLPPDDNTERFRCEFEEDLCGFTLEDRKGKWLLTYHNDLQANLTYPEQDHTYNTGYGKYLAAPLNCSENGVVGKVRTPDFSHGENQAQCLSFWYVHNGHSNKDSVAVRIRHGLDVFPSALWRETNNHLLAWLEANIPIPARFTKFQVEWEANQQSRSQEGVIAIDDVKLVIGECPSIGSCTFETGTCGWQNLFENVNVTEDTNDWLQGSGDNHLNNAGPAADHHNDTSGHFLYVDGLVAGTALLESQLLVPEQHSDFCFSFWYYIKGEMDDKMSISVVAESGKEKEVWLAGETAGWAEGRVRVKATELIFIEVAYQLYIRGIHTSNKSVIALDDFSFVKKIDCPRKPQIPVTEEPPASSTPAPTILWSCDFTQTDDTMCGLILSGEGEWYPYVNVNTTQHNHDKYSIGFTGRDGQEGRATLPHLADQEGLACLSFYYMIETANRGNFSVMLTSNTTGESKTLWSRSEPHGTVWIEAHVHVHLNNATMVEFVGGMGLQNEGLLGLDDMVLTAGGCNHIYPDSILCDFEEPGVCGFSSQPGLANWTWVFPLQDMNASLTPHIPTDHTSQSGYGHYMEAALVPSDHDGVVGWLATPWISQPKNTSLCVAFWYVHNGATNRDRLSVYANRSTQVGVGSHLWQEKASYVDKWLSASVPVPGGGQRSVQVLWEAFQGQREDHSSMAVDDVKITMLSCDTLGTCTFTYGTCGWQNVIAGEELRDETDWLVGSGVTGADLDAPEKDHNGDREALFLYVDSKFAETGRATLQSQMFVPDQDNNLCFHFWYYLKGDNVSLTIEVDAEDASRKEVWRQDVLSGPWKEGQMHVKAEHFLNAEAYQILITGEKNGKFDVIAIDDFNFTSFHYDCPTLPSQTLPTTTTTLPPQTLPTTTTSTTTTPSDLIEEVSCDFDDHTFCEWSHGAGDHIWALQSNIWPTTHNVGPTADHTTGEGYFMSLTPTHAHNEGVAIITSPVISPASTTQALCLRWWYHMDGSDVGTLSVHLIVVGGEESVIWTKKGFQTAWWSEAFIGVPGGEEFVLEVRGSQGSNPLSNLAVDDISMASHVCPENVQTMASVGAVCTFEQGSTCGMEADSEPGWTLAQASPTDHTTATQQGHAYELRGGSNPITSKLKSPAITVQDTQCVGFYYWMEGTEDASLTVFVDNGSGKNVSESLVLTKMGEPRWRVAVTGLYRYYGPHLNVVFIGSVGPNKDTVIAVDDIFVTLEMCSPIISVACSFVNTTCLWTNDPDSLQWIAADSYSDQTLNGPADDKDPYHYVMFDIVPHHRPGDSARLVSPTLTRTYMTTSICFNFNFAACCEHGGILSVIMVDIGNNNETLLWQLPITSDYAESQWQLGRVEIQNTPENYALVMQGEVWDGREGYLALKDFHLTEPEFMYCSLVPESATPEPPSILPPATILPLLVDPKSSLDCDFEDASHPSCDFIDEGEVGYWLRVNASSPLNVYNPIIDNTFKNDSGHYLMAQFPGAGLNEKVVQLRTPALKSSVDYCLTFFLHHVGDNPPPLIVKAEMLAGALHVELLRRDYPLQDMWVLVEREVQAGTMDGPYAITINAMMKQAQEGDVSIDDLKVVESRCPKEDDMSCSFTLGLCGFMQEETKDDLDWLWHDATGPDDPYLPMETKAHDYYIYLNTSSFKGSSAVIYSTEYRLSGPHCATFDVHLHSELQQTALLQVLDIGEGTIEDGVLLLMKQNDLGYDWATLQIPLEPSMKPFRLAFRGIIGDMDQTHSTFALDNIKLTPGACHAPAACSFEDGLCGWVRDELDLDWELAGPEDLSLATRPYADATQRNHNGGFLYVEAEEHLQFSAATLRSQIFPPSITENCLTFWYHIYGSFRTNLAASVQAVDYGEIIPVWDYIIPHSRWDTGWNYASTPFSSKYKFQLHIGVYLADDFMGDVAVDDIVVASGGCAVTPEEAAWGVTYVSPAPHTRTQVQPSTAARGPDVHDCTFDQDLCSWSSSMGEVRTRLQTQAHRNMI